MSEQLRKFPHTFTQGDRLPEIEFLLTDDNDVGIDLSGHTITLRLRQPDGTLIVRTAVDIDLPNGSGKFTWADGDLVAGLDQRVEVRFVDPGGKPQTSDKFLIDVTPTV